MVSASVSASEPTATSGSSSTPAVQKIKWSDDDVPHAYFLKYEQAMSCNGEPKSQWGHLH